MSYYYKEKLDSDMKYHPRSKVYAYEKYFMYERTIYRSARRIQIIEGWAGTGKTTLAKKRYSNAIMAAPTAKAAENIGGITIHKLLKWHPDFSPRLGEFKYTRDIVIDEASMVSIDAMFYLCRYSTRNIILVGDPYQLLPVGEGFPFHSLLAYKDLHVTKLETVFRNKFNISAMCNDGFIDLESDEFVKYMPGVSYFEAMCEHNAPILCYRNKTRETISESVKNSKQLDDYIYYFVPETDEQQEIQFYIGEPVIFRTNNDIVYNGLTGIYVGKGLVHCSNRKQVYLNDLPDSTVLQSAIALTVHSVQGLEFDTVIVLIDDPTLIDRRWLYTAVTRAKRLAVICDPENCIGDIMQNTGASPEPFKLAE